MQEVLRRHGARMFVTLLPLVLALLHAVGVLQIGLIQQLDDVIYDARLRFSLSKGRDDRIVVVDIDEQSLARVGRWPWSRDKVALLLDRLFDEHHVALLGFDVVFAEPDTSSGLAKLQSLARNELKDLPAFAEKLQQLAPGLDFDAMFAKSLANRPVVLGYYFTSDRDGLTSGVLPRPVMDTAALQGRPIRFTSWTGYGANLPSLSAAAPTAGFFNPIVDGDGKVRSVPLVAEYQGQYYESLALAMYRLVAGAPQVVPGFPRERFLSKSYHGLDSLVLQRPDWRQEIPVDSRVSALVPFRGPGGVKGGTFQYVSAVDILDGRVPAGSLRDKVILVGTTAPGLQDLRVTPVGEAYPGVEVHANLIAGLMDGHLPAIPDYALGFDAVVLTLTGVCLALVLPLVSAPAAVLISAIAFVSLLGLNLLLFKVHDLVMPLGGSLSMIVMAFGLNMSYGYFVESRSKRELAKLFGNYVPPALVDEMVKQPETYSMEAQSRELTVMFCDMRGFTQLSEGMEPTQLQNLLNRVFSRLTAVISAQLGTIDKYMGDCVMAFWGAPVGQEDHARRAIAAALDMIHAIELINQEHAAQGLPRIGIGIGVNTGLMCVGDMGSDDRLAYTVIGDTVNLGSRLEGLSKYYGAEIVVSEFTRKQVPDYVWQELDRVKVKGKQQAVTIYTPLGLQAEVDKSVQDELKAWQAFLKCYRSQDWEQADLQLFNLHRFNANKPLYVLYAERVASLKMLPVDPEWDGATSFETK